VFLEYCRTSEGAKMRDLQLGTHEDILWRAGETVFINQILDR
jgi:hypothetical protein